MTDIIMAILFGLSFGSFLNVLIVRIPQDESIIFGSSHCTSCGHKLHLWHNIPLLSWVFLRGKCAFCDAKISLQYPLVELGSALIFFLIHQKYGISTPALFIALSFLMLLSLSTIDIKYKMVPDSLNLLAIFFAVFAAWDIQGFIQNIQNAMIFAGAFTLLRFALSYMLTASASREAKKVQTSWTKNYHTYPFIEAMGEGDIMVAATMGALLGVKLTLFAIFLSAVLALPIMIFLQRKSGQRESVPFVPFLALATLITLLNDSLILAYIEAYY